MLANLCRAPQGRNLFRQREPVELKVFRREPMHSQIIGPTAPTITQSWLLHVGLLLVANVLLNHTRLLRALVDAGLVPHRAAPVSPQRVCILVEDLRTLERLRGGAVMLAAHFVGVTECDCAVAG